MFRTVLLLFLFLLLNSLNAQELKSYQIYDKDGQSRDFGRMTEALKDYDVVLFGEYHNNSILHWLQLQTTKALYEFKGNQLVLGAEMFERDNQDQLDLYVAGLYTEKEFGKEARLWPNFHTDYKPLADFAAKNELRFIATNVPRKYAAMVARFDQDTLQKLPQKEREYMAQLPFEVDINTPGYRELLDMFRDHAGENVHQYVAAQAIKDATMAESILQNLNKGELLLHYQGDYHSKEYGGIYWYLKKKNKRLKVAVISVAESFEAHLPLPHDFIKTDFVIVVPGDMTKTY